MTLVSLMDRLVPLLRVSWAKPINCINHDPIYYPSGIHIVQRSLNIYEYDPVYTHTHTHTAIHTQVRG